LLDFTPFLLTEGVASSNLAGGPNLSAQQIADVVLFDAGDEEI